MAYTLGNMNAKNLCKRTVLLQVIIENVVVCFFLEHSVYMTWPLCIFVTPYFVWLSMLTAHRCASLYFIVFVCASK